METHVERLRDYLAARDECLSGHEMARAGTPPAGPAPDELRGAQLLADVLVEDGVLPQALRAALGLEAAGEQDVHALVRKALESQSLDALVERLDQAFELEIEPRTRMAP